jgi:hypothetical protein
VDSTVPCAEPPIVPYVVFRVLSEMDGGKHAPVRSRQGVVGSDLEPHHSVGEIVELVGQRGGDPWSLRVVANEFIVFRVTRVDHSVSVSGIACKGVQTVHVRLQHVHRMGECLHQLTVRIDGKSWTTGRSPSKRPNGSASATCGADPSPVGTSSRPSRERKKKRRSGFVAATTLPSKTAATIRRTHPGTSRWPSRCDSALAPSHVQCARESRVGVADVGHPLPCTFVGTDR